MRRVRSGVSHVFFTHGALKLQKKKKKKKKKKKTEL